MASITTSEPGAAAEIASANTAGSFGTRTQLELLARRVHPVDHRTPTMQIHTDVLSLHRGLLLLEGQVCKPESPNRDPNPHGERRPRSFIASHSGVWITIPGLCNPVLADAEIGQKGLHLRLDWLVLRACDHHPAG